MTRAIRTTPPDPRLASGGRPRWAAVLLPVLFFGWMYGSSLLLLLGLLNQVAWMSLDEHPLIGWYYVAGLIMAFAVPMVGLGFATLGGQPQWSQWFGWALGLAFVALLLVAAAWSVTDAPRFHDRESPAVEDDSSNPYQDCVAISGGSNTCPGG